MFGGLGGSTCSGGDRVFWAVGPIILQVLGVGHCWVAVKELNLSYYIGETLLFTIHTHYGNLIYVP